MDPFQCTVIPESHSRYIGQYYKQNKTFCCCYCYLLLKLSLDPTYIIVVVIQFHTRSSSVFIQSLVYSRRPSRPHDNQYKHLTQPFRYCTVLYCCTAVVLLHISYCMVKKVKAASHNRNSQHQPVHTICTLVSPASIN